MKNWRKLSKKELIHLVETMHSNTDIEHSFIKTRQGQREMAEGINHQEVCYMCKRIAIKLDIEQR